MSERVSTDETNLTTHAFNLLCKLGEGKKLKPDQVYELLELLKTMSGSNVITTIDALRAEMNSKLGSIDALRAEMNSRLDAQNSKFDSIRWTIGIVGGAVTIVLTIIGFLITSGS